MRVRHRGEAVFKSPQPGELGASARSPVDDNPTKSLSADEHAVGVSDNTPTDSAATVFISYSRTDSAFLNRIKPALENRRIRTFVDEEDIEKGEPFTSRIKELILSADLTLFVVSPESVVSDFCLEEISFAAENGKRVVPLIWKQPTTRLPQPVAETNWISAEAYRLSDMTDTSQFEQLVDELQRAINFGNVQWVREHSKWITRASAWDTNGRRSGALLPTGDLESIQQWIGRRPNECPAVPLIVFDFVQASADHQRRTRLRERRMQAGIAILMCIAAVVFVLGAIGLGRLMTQINSRTSRTLTVLAARSNNSADFESGARYALAALNGADAFALSYDASMPEGILRAAFLNNRRSNVIFAHSGPIETLAVSPNGELIASASADRTARIWEASTGKQILNCSMRDPDADKHKGWIEQGAEDDNESPALVTFSPSGHQMLAAYGSSAFLWDVGDGRMLHRVCHCEDTDDLTSITSVRFAPDGRNFLTGSLDGTIRLWSAVKGTLRHKVKLGHDYVRSAEYSSDGRLIVSAHNDGHIIVINTTTGSQVLMLPGHHGRAFGAVFSRDTRHLVTWGDDNAARVWDTGSGKQEHILWHSGFIHSAIFSNDGQYVLTASADGKARLWSVKSGELRTTYESRDGQVGHDGAVTSAKFSCDAKQVLTSGSDGTARLWNTLTGTLLNIFAAHQGRVNSVSFSKDCSQIITAGDDETIRFWRTDVGVPAQTLDVPGRFGSIADISPDHRRVVFSLSEKKGALFDTETKKVIALQSGGSGSVSNPSFSPDGSIFVTSGNDGTALVWNSRDGRLVRVLPGSSKRVHSTAFSSSGDRLAVVGEDGVLTIWDLLSHSKPKTFSNRATSYPDISLFVSHDHGLIVCCDSANMTYLYNTDSGNIIASMDGHPVSVTTNADGADRTTFLMLPRDGGMELHDSQSGRVIRRIADPMDSQSNLSTASFMSDRGQALIGRDDGTVELWDVVNGVELRKFETLDGRVNRAVFVSPAGKRALAASPDGTVQVLDLEVGLVLSVLRGHTGPAVNAATSRDGRLGITQGNDNSVRLWVLPGETPEKRSLVSLVCRDLLLRSAENGHDDFAHLTPEERAAAPSVDPVRDFKTEGDVCSPVSPWSRLLGALGRN